MLDSPLLCRALSLALSRPSTPPEAQPDAEELRRPLLNALSRYHDLLDTWNRRFNLVSRATGLVELIADGLVDAAALGVLLPAGSLVADVGAGAGLPAFPLALLRPDLRLCLVEPRLHRANFLRRLAGVFGEAGLTARSVNETSGWRVHQERIENLRADELSASLDDDPVFVYTRAVWGAEEAWEACRHLIEPASALFCLSGPTEPEPSRPWSCSTYEALLPGSAPWNRRRVLCRHG